MTQSLSKTRLWSIYISSPHKLVWGKKKGIALQVWFYFCSCKCDRKFDVCCGLGQIEQVMRCIARIALIVLFLFVKLIFFLSSFVTVFSPVLALSLFLLYSHLLTIFPLALSLFLPVFLYFFVFLSLLSFSFCTAVHSSRRGTQSLRPEKKL